MIEKSFIEELVHDFTDETEMFLVRIKVSSTNKITVFVDTRNGVTIDECVELHRHIEKNLDRETEDFELQVSSPGLDSSFIVIKQYYKNEGRKVEVVDEDGQKHSGILKNVTQGGFDLETEVKIKGKGKEIKPISFNFEQVKTTKIVL
ncbi:MAG TPA: ribosome assembly cofactor RimP [Bacteroidetes bacterium]|jgi:ribosome maturation factor RimP|nr:ribosome assembly cofactor RimP [Bacteroidota bacterium]